MMKRDIRHMAMGASLAVSVLMLVGKMTAYVLTGSQSILSDAAESVVHIFATGVAAFSLWYSQQEACQKHPYGHGKIVYFSAGFEGALILAAGLFIIISAGKALLEGARLSSLEWGLGITLALALVNLALGVFLIRVGRKRNTFVLVANGRHVLSDMWTSFAVVVGVALVAVTGISWLDPVVAILVACNIFYHGGELILRSYRGLLDQADPAESERLSRRLNQFVEQGVVNGFHQLRHRKTDDVVWAELHVLLPGDLPVREAHERVSAVEKGIVEEFPNYHVYVTTHMEPVRHESAHPGGHPGMRDPLGGTSSNRAGKSKG